MDRPPVRAKERSIFRYMWKVDFNVIEDMRKGMLRG